MTKVLEYDRGERVGVTADGKTVVLNKMRNNRAFVLNGKGVAVLVEIPID